MAFIPYNPRQTVGTIAPMPQVVERIDSGYAYEFDTRLHPSLKRLKRGNTTTLMNTGGTAGIAQSMNPQQAAFQQAQFANFHTKPSSSVSGNAPTTGIYTGNPQVRELKALGAA